MVQHLEWSWRKICYFLIQLTIFKRYSRYGIFALLDGVFNSHSLAKRLNNKFLRDRLALCVGSTADTALGLGHCLGVVVQAVGAGELLASAVRHFSSFLICCLQKE